MIDVVVVDDQPLVRRAVRDILTDSGAVRVVGEAADGLEAVDAVSRLAPDVVLMDIRMPVLDGIEATARISATAGPEGPRVLILTTFEEDDYIVAALRAGAGGFIGKAAEPADIVRAVQTIHAGDSLFSPRATRLLVERSIARRPVPDAAARERLAPLTSREREIVALVATGRTNGQIAEALVISEHTAKTHVNRAMSKLGARDRAQLVVVAYESGLVAPGGGGPLT